jgi:VanZ family protein
MKKLLNSLPGRLLCAAAVLLMVVGLFVGGAQPVAVGLLTDPWDKLAHATVFAMLTALLALALQGRALQPGARWALRPGAALAVAAVLAGAVGVADELHQATLPGRVAGLDDLLADAVGVCVGLWVARGGASALG